MFKNWKYAIRHKARKIVEDQKATGGGPSTSTSLTDIEERAVKVWGKVVTTGVDAQSVGLSETCTPQRNSTPVHMQGELMEPSVCETDAVNVLTPPNRKRRAKTGKIFHINILYIH